MTPDDLRRLRVFVPSNETRFDALTDLFAHVAEYNARFGTGWSLSAPKRPRWPGVVVGKASDHNHLLYQDHVDAILSGVAAPITTKAIRQRLVDMGEKPSTAKLLAPDYFKLIVKILDPSTKRHRGAEATLEKWGSL